jgi:peptide/nickel transport system ATP-binding protein
MTAPLLRVRDLSVTFRDGRRRVDALADCNLELERGSILALVGESGSGKSTLARAVAGIVRPTTGTIELDGRDLSRLSGQEKRTQRRRIQMVFQDPDASLNPYHSVGFILREPLAVTGQRDRRRAVARSEELMALVGLDPALLTRRPRELSGGQKQRVAIARAIALEPDLLIADEALSALDVTTQAAISALLSELRERLGLAILFISHDLGMVAHLADTVAVMRAGRILEQGPCTALLSAPAHPYTRLLLEATPDLDRGGLDLQRAETTETFAGDLTP